MTYVWLLPASQLFPPSQLFSGSQLSPASQLYLMIQLFPGSQLSTESQSSIILRVSKLIEFNLGSPLAQAGLLDPLQTPQAPRAPRASQTTRSTMYIVYYQSPLAIYSFKFMRAANCHSYIYRLGFWWFSCPIEPSVPLSHPILYVVFAMANMRFWICSKCCPHFFSYVIEIVKNRYPRFLGLPFDFNAPMRTPRLPLVLQDTPTFPRALPRIPLALPRYRSILTLPCIPKQADICAPLPYKLLHF